MNNSITINGCAPRFVAILAVLILTTSIIGGFRYFSPVPYFDQWDGYIGFYGALKSGHYDAFWAQHMEHRILFSRVLFWLDITLFRGLNVFTVICNYVILGLIGWSVWREYRKNGAREYSALLIGGLIIGLLFSWSQKDNLIWGFQSQSIATYLFTLLAAAQFTGAQPGNFRIVIAILFCFLATFSMGNGMASFAVIALQTVLLRRPIREPLLLFAAGAIAAACYFHGYVKPVLPVDAAAAGLFLPKVRYFFIFIGNPFYDLIRSVWLSFVMGVAAFSLFVLLTLHHLKKKQITPYRSYLMAGYGMFLISALAASNSRWVLGLESAATGRYMTPSLIGLLMLSLLVFDTVKFNFRTKRTAVTICVFLFTLIAAGQVKVFRNNQKLYQWKLALLTEQIGLDHRDLDAQIYPESGHDHLIRSMGVAKKYRIGPYGQAWLRGAGSVKFDPARVDGSVCAGEMVSTSADSVGVVSTGWVETHQLSNSDVLVLLVNGTGTTVGYGVSGMSRSLLPGASSEHAPRDGGWTAFSAKDGQPLRAFAYLSGHFCPLTSKMSAP